MKKLQQNNQNSRLSFWQLFWLSFKIFVEIILFFVLINLIEILFWWSILDIAHTSGCQTVDLGLFKPGSYKCPEKLWYGSFLEDFMSSYMEKVGIPLFMLIFALLLVAPTGLPIFFSVIFLVVAVMNWFSWLPKETPKFPVLSRLALSSIQKIVFKSKQILVGNR